MAAEEEVHPSQRVEEVVSVPTGDAGLGDDEVEESHPAFGMIQVTRRQGTARPLFQSDIQHEEVVRLSIHTAVRRRALGRDWLHPRRELIEVEMSLTQWGSAISSANIGTGTPVTLRRTQDDPYVPGMPYAPRIRTSLDEVSSSISQATERVRKTLAALTGAIESKSGVRAVREALRSHALSVEGIEKRAEHSVKSMAEAAASIVADSRADIEAHALNAQRAVAASGEALPALPAAPVIEASSEPAGLEACRLCNGSGKVAVGPWGARPTKATCHECHGAKRLPRDHEYADHTV